MAPLNLPTFEKDKNSYYVDNLSEVFVFSRVLWAERIQKVHRAMWESGRNREGKQSRLQIDS